jgi:hypothetical protein
MSDSWLDRRLKVEDGRWAYYPCARGGYCEQGEEVYVVSQVFLGCIYCISLRVNNSLGFRESLQDVMDSEILAQIYIRSHSC